MISLEMPPRTVIKFVGGSLHNLGVPVECAAPGVPGMTSYWTQAGEHYGVWLEERPFGWWFLFVLHGYDPTPVDLWPNGRELVAN